MTIRRLMGVTLALSSAGYGTSPAQSQSSTTTTATASTYWVYVANESSDLVSRVRFGPDGAIEEKTISVGIKPADLDGAHGLTVSQAGDYWYVTLAHGTPYGKVWQYRTGTDEFIDQSSRATSAQQCVGGVHAVHGRGEEDRNLRHASREQAEH